MWGFRHRKAGASSRRHLPSSDDMLKRFRQSGAFLLVTVIFLMVAGGTMLYALANLSTVSSATNSVVHNGNMALAAAQSGLKYCVAQLETAACTANPEIIGITAPGFSPCKVKIVDGGCFTAGTGICTVTSTACCSNSSSADDPYHGAKKLSIQVQKTAGGYQIIPASRQTIVPDACPL